MVRVDKLKKKLALLKLSTVGTKEELQQRIKAAMEEEAQQNNKDQSNLNSEICSTRSSESTESYSVCGEKVQMNQMLETIQKIMLENSVQLLEMENKFQEYTQRQEYLLAEQQMNLEEKLRKQQEITDGLREKVEKLEKCLEKMQDRVKCLEGGGQTDRSEENCEVISFTQENGIVNSQSGRTIANMNSIRDFNVEQKPNEMVVDRVQHILPEISDLNEKLAKPLNYSYRFEPPTFDGRTPFNLFRLQFETSMKANQWNNEERLTALILALRGSALAELQVLPDEDKSNYEMLMNALKRKYDNEQFKETYRIALKSRLQNYNETLQDHASEIERLAHLAYDFEISKDHLEKYKIEAFINGIMDPTVKYAALTNPKLTLLETLTNAMAHEAAAKLAGYKREPVMDKDNIIEAICKAVKSAVRAELQSETSNNK